MKHLVLNVCAASVVMLAGASSCAQVLPNSIIAIVDALPGNEESGKQLTITALQTNKPIVVYPSGFDGDMEVLMRSKSTIVLQQASFLGSTDTIYLDLKHKAFTRVAVTQPIDPDVKKVSVVVTTGTWK